MGVPKNYIEKSKRNFKGEAMQENRLVKQSVLAYRADVNAFHTFIYNLQFKDRDDAFLTEKTEEVKKVDKQSSTEDTRLTEKTLRKISRIRKSNRVVVKFNKNPFITDVPLLELKAIHEEGALTDDEYYKLLRARLDLDTVNFIPKDKSQSVGDSNDDSSNSVSKTPTGPKEIT